VAPQDHSQLAASFGGCHPRFIASAAAAPVLSRICAFLMRRTVDAPQSVLFDNLMRQSFSTCYTLRDHCLSTCTRKESLHAILSPEEVPRSQCIKEGASCRLSMMSKGNFDIGDGSGEGPVDMGNKATSFCDIIFFFFFHLLLPINLSSLRLQFFFFFLPRILVAGTCFVSSLIKRPCSLSKPKSPTMNHWGLCERHGTGMDRDTGTGKGIGK
jgi:hypothetical protein